MNTTKSLLLLMLSTILVLSAQERNVKSLTSRVERKDVGSIISKNIKIKEEVSLLIDSLKYIQMKIDSIDSISLQYNRVINRQQNNIKEQSLKIKKLKDDKYSQRD